MDTIRTIINIARVVLVAVAFLAFIAALLDPPIGDEPMLFNCVTEGDPMLLKCTTEDKPAEESAGAYAALIAVMTGGLALLRVVPTRRRIRRVFDFLTGIGLLATGYLWMAAETETHPRSLEIPIFLLVLFGLTAVLILLPLVPILAGVFADRMSRRSEHTSICRPPDSQSQQEIDQMTASNRISESSLQEIEIALERYREAIEASPMTQSTKQTRHGQAALFVRWLKSDYDPGQGLEPPRR